MRMRKLLPVLLMLLTASLIPAQSAQVTSSTQVKGRVMDSTGSILLGVQIKVYRGDKVVKEGTTAATGDFEIPLEAGEYKLELTAPDFEKYTEVVNVTPGMGPLSITMLLAQITQNVEVNTDRNEISIDPDSSLNTTVLDKEFIETLPDDEDELATYLQQIAGSRGGTGGGGNFVIDGFGGGRVPPKDQIQEIRINNNPFSSEFSGVGYGRVEIITKPGTGDYRGNLNFEFRDESLNARNPFSPTRPPSQMRNFNSNFSGPIIRNKLTLNLNARHLDNENSDTIRAILPGGEQLSQAVVIPNQNRRLEGRSQLALTANNTMYMNFNLLKTDATNQGVGNFNLESRASERHNRSTDLQFREVAILTKSTVHEVRFAYSHDRAQTTPKTTAIAINVLDSFFGGGSQNRSWNNNRDTEFGNLLMYSGKKWTLKTGFQSMYRIRHSLSENNFVGTFTFSSLNCRIPNPVDPKDDPCAGAYSAGRPTTFSRTQGDPRLDVNQFEYGTFFQSDWKMTQKFNLSLGARYEGQTNISDHNNIDPRMGFAYQLAKTAALRGGAGVFHQRFDENTVEQLLRLDGTRQEQIVIRYPTFCLDLTCLNFSGMGTSNTPPSLRVRAPELVTPYNINTSLSLEKSLPKGLGLTFSWDVTRGVHLYRSRNLNAPLPGAPLNPARPGTFLPPDPTKGNINQLESTGTSLSNNYTIGFRQQIRNKWNLNLFGNYTLGNNNSDTDNAFNTPADNYNLRGEWGRSGQDTRHRFFTGTNFRLPWGVNVNTNVNWSSSRPYNITTGLDNNGDTVLNDRPEGLKRNSGKGPGLFNMNMGFQKTVILKSPEKPTIPANNGANPFASSFAEPQRGGGGGFPGGGGDFGGQRGNFPGGQRGGGQRGQGGRGPDGGFNQQRGPSVTFRIQVQNVLNNQQLNSYSGVMTSPFFGKANSARNPRQVEAGLRFNF